MATFCPSSSPTLLLGTPGQCAPPWQQPGEQDLKFSSWVCWEQAIGFLKDLTRKLWTTCQVGPLLLSWPPPRTSLSVRNHLPSCLFSTPWELPILRFFWEPSPWPRQKMQLPHPLRTALQVSHELPFSASDQPFIWDSQRKTFNLSYGELLRGIIPNYINQEYK